jgi:outer membrane protein assembly factor BamB
MLTSLVACGSVFKRGGGTDKEPPPEPLPKIDMSVTLDRDWSFDIGTSLDEGGQHLTPAIDGEQVYIADPEGHISAAGLSDGKRRWSTKLDAVISGGVGAGHGLVLVGTSKGVVHALDARDGKQLWNSRVSSEVLTPPVTANRVVVARAGDGRIYGLSAVNGASQWSFRRSVPSLSLRGAGTPSLYKQVVVLGFASGKIVAAEVETGRIIWDVNVTQPRGRNEVERLVDIDARPVLAGSVIYVAAYQGRVTALALGSRRILWARDVSTYNDLSVDEANIYVTDEQDTVFALDRLTGTTVWTQESLKRRRLSPPTAKGSYVFVGDKEGYLHVLRKSDGQLVGRSRLKDGAVIGAPISQGSQLLVLTQGGTLTSLTVNN